MKEKKSFYDLIVEGAARKEEKEEKVEGIYRVIAWLILFLFGTSLLHITWNWGVTPLFGVPRSNYLESLLLYTFLKLIRGGIV